MLWESELKNVGIKKIKERTFQIEGLASAKALGWVDAWHIGGTDAK